jgi:hypothetical protein
MRTHLLSFIFYLYLTVIVSGGYFMCHSEEVRIIIPDCVKRKSLLRKGERQFIYRLPLSWWFRLCNEVHFGGAFKMALALWYLAGLLKKRTGLPLTTASLMRFNVDRYSKARALDALAAAGLIRIVRREPRKNPVVDLLDVDGNAEGQEEEPSDR